jgi:hypothetical protein
MNNHGVPSGPAPVHAPGERLRRPGFDGARFGVRFVCGFLLGAIVGFGFWVQMCRPLYMTSPMGQLPRLLTEWLGWEPVIDSGVAGGTVVLLFALLFGLVVAVWPLFSRGRAGR